MAAPSELEKLRDENRRLRLLMAMRATSDAHVVSVGDPPGGVVTPEQKAKIVQGIEHRLGLIDAAKTGEEKVTATERYFAVLRSALTSKILTVEEAEVFAAKVQLPAT